MNELPRLSQEEMTPVFGGRLSIFDIQQTLEDLARESPEKIEITMEKRPDGCYYTMFYMRKEKN